MKKLLFITTGGTIASGGDNGLAPEKSGKAMLDGIISGCEYDILDLYAIDSTDLSIKHLEMLHSAVCKNLPLYDGIVILHGTDTMAYTGAMLYLTLKTEKAVILTGSMLPFGAENSDAADNIRFAAECALKEQGVWLAFGGRVICGGDIAKVNAREKDAFRSYSEYRTEERFAFPEKERALPKVIKLSPFSSASDFEISANGAVIETYGTGGLPDSAEILYAVKTLAEKMPVIITTPCLGGAELSRYAVGRRALSLGAEEGKMSTECALVYLWLKE